jgi:hypothetical protein
MIVRKLLASKLIAFIAVAASGLAAAENGPVPAASPKATARSKLPFSLIYWSADYPRMKQLGLADDSTWYVGVMRQGYDYRFVDGAPDQVVIESWVGAPSRAVPETGDWTFTRSVRDFVQKFVGPKN